QRLLQAGGHVGQRLGRRGMVAQILAQRGLEAAEAEVEAAALERSAREADRLGIALAREAVDRRPARVAQAEQLRRLVERLPHRVVARPPEAGVIARAARPGETRVAPPH